MRADFHAARRVAVVVTTTLQLALLAACADGSQGSGAGDRQLTGAGGAGLGPGAGTGGANAPPAGMAGTAATGMGGSAAEDAGVIEDGGGGTSSDTSDASGTGGSGGQGGASGTGSVEPDAAQEMPDEPIDAGMPNTEDPDGDGDPSWPPAPASEELSGLPEQLASGICAALDGCLGPTLLEVALDGSDCEARTADELRDGEFVFLQASIDAERVSFDPDGVAACVADYAALGCEVVASRAPPSCKSMLQGEVELGDACVLDDDCVAGAFCDRQDACPGLCAALSSAGGECDRNDQCTSGLQCLGGECGEDAGEGEACDGGVAPPCHLGTMCIGDDADQDQAGTCRDQSDLFVVEEGDECDVIAGQWCEDGLACVVDVVDSGGSASVVTVCKARVGSGDECHTSLLPQQCPTGEYCPADLDPDYLASCAVRPSSGEACGAFGICAPDHYCDGTYCRPFRLVQGMPCTLDGECLSQRCEPDEDAEGSHCNALDRCRYDEPGECGDDACSVDETCTSCALDCGACPPEPVCGDETCNGAESCETCDEDCGACAPACGDDACQVGETCASCDEDCGVCPAPYSGPCDADADCAPDQSCVQETVPGLLGLTPDVHYGYCAEACEVVADCAASPSQRTCTAEGACALSCDPFACLLDRSWCCPVGDECIDAVCTHRL